MYAYNFDHIKETNKFKVFQQTPLIPLLHQICYQQLLVGALSGNYTEGHVTLSQTQTFL
jgi:hypothetical protein